MTLSPVLNILGLLTTILGAAMLIPMCFDLYLSLIHISEPTRRS